MATLNCIIIVQSVGDNDAVRKMLKYFNKHYLYYYANSVTFWDFGIFKL